MTCTAVYTRESRMSAEYWVRNFKGSTSITVADQPNVMWSKVLGAEATPSDYGFEADTEHARYSYGASAHNDETWQSCGAGTRLYSAERGEWVEEGQLFSKEEYLDAIKDGIEFEIQSGFRVWDQKDDYTTRAAADAPVHK